MKIPIVFSTQRSGSSFLFLHFHPTIHHVCYEPYNSDNERKEYDPIRQTKEFKSRLIDPFAYIKFLSQYGVIDMKLELTPPNVLTALFNRGAELNPLMLFRTNRLQQYISLLTANRSNTFHSEKNVEEEPLTVNPEAFDAYRRKMDKLYRDTYEKLNPWLQSYEGFCISDVAQLLKINVQHKPKTAKLHKDYSFVTNREELLKTYKGYEL